MRPRRTTARGRFAATLAIDLTVRAVKGGDDAERAEHVRSLIRCLPDIDQEIVRLVYWDGFTQEQVATIIGKSATAVRARLSRARGVLRDRLAEGGDVE
ncbi:RNA polymerase sigma factor [Microbacterium psychrotolerans]|uniref:RNA polymerase sigma factor n=1 Tax=Microbacterium psychrotolerans TaxID=3068321 RepID=UPI003AAA95D5